MDMRRGLSPLQGSTWGLSPRMLKLATVTAAPRFHWLYLQSVPILPFTLNTEDLVHMYQNGGHSLPRLLLKGSLGSLTATSSR